MFLKATMEQQLIHFSCATVMLENRECTVIKYGNAAIDFRGKAPFRRWWNDGLNFYILMKAQQASSFTADLQKIEIFIS